MLNATRSILDTTPTRVPVPSAESSLNDIPVGRTVESAWSELKPTLERLVRLVSARQVMEIGAGRHPFFSAEEARALGFSLTLNDIDEVEIRNDDRGFRTAVFDIGGDIGAAPVQAGTFDLIYSRMVFEHVRDGRRAWSNVYRLLAPGGVGFAFVPTLYSPPFVLNRITPESITSKLVRALDRTRNAAEIPKFPAYYSACRASEKALEPMLAGIGFGEVRVVPFFGTPYFPRIPVLRNIFRVFDRISEKRDWRAFASYAYLIARK